jgi:hypothetical protein
MSPLRPTSNVFPLTFASMRHSLPSPSRRDDRSCDFTWIRRRTAPSLDASDHFRHPNLHHTTPHHTTPHHTKPPSPHARTHKFINYTFYMFLHSYDPKPSHLGSYPSSVSAPEANPFSLQDPNHSGETLPTTSPFGRCLASEIRPFRPPTLGSRTTTAVSTSFFVELDAQGRETRAPWPPTRDPSHPRDVCRPAFLSRPCFLPRIRSSTVHVRLL